MNCKWFSKRILNDYPITAEPTLPCLTIRTWFLGSHLVLFCPSLINSLVTTKIHISSVIAQIVVLPLVRLVAAYLPKKFIHIPGTKTFFSLIPGPFNLREHVLITIFANSGSNSVYAINIITIVKVFYHRGIHPLAAILLSHTTQVIYVYALLRLYDYTYWNCFIFFLNDLILWIIQLLGYGWAGLLRKYLIDSSYMWWPSNLVQVSLFRCH